ncbi:MAG: GspH/FimT family pseudopilin [Gammaproteobacteria bacterium]|nr:GspH/FimT family pseudopilin [Gammaproteobacteria bacterium]
MPRQRHERGFTLIELLVTIAVMAIIMGLAVPSFMSTMAGARLTTAANELLATIQHTRSEAIRRGVRVTLCKAGSTANQCDTTATTPWSDGWMNFTDPVAQTPPQVDAASSILVRGGGHFAPDIVIAGKSGSATALYVSFTPDGASKLMNGGFLAGTIRVCSTSSSLDNDHRARDIVINSTGRATIQRPTGIAATCPAP